MLQHGVVAEVRVIPRVVELAQVLGCLPNQTCKDVDVDGFGTCHGCIQPEDSVASPWSCVCRFLHTDFRNRWRGAVVPFTQGQRSRSTRGQPTPPPLAYSIVKEEERGLKNHNR